MNVTGQPNRLHVPALEVVAARQRAGACPGYLRALLLVGVASLGATVGNPATWTIAAGRSIAKFSRSSQTTRTRLAHVSLHRPDDHDQRPAGQGRRPRRTRRAT
jgi:hypothetical protein